MYEDQEQWKAQNRTLKLYFMFSLNYNQIKSSLIFFWRPKLGTLISHLTIKNKNKTKQNKNKNKKQNETLFIRFCGRLWFTSQNMSDPGVLLWIPVLTKLKNHCLTQKKKKKLRFSLLLTCYFSAITWTCMKQGTVVHHFKDWLR